MTHAEAVAIIKGPREPGVDGYRRYAAACTEVYIDHMARTRPDTFTTDAARKPVSEMTMDEKADLIIAHIERRKGKRMKTRDQPSPSGMGNYSFPSREQSEMGNRTGGVHPVGGEVVMVLDPRFTYYVGKNDAGAVCLFRHGTSEGSLNSGKTTADRAATMRSMRTVDEQRQAQQRTIGSRVRDFWKQQAGAA